MSTPDKLSYRTVSPKCNILNLISVPGSHPEYANPAVPEQLGTIEISPVFVNTPVCSGHCIASTAFRPQVRVSGRFRQHNTLARPVSLFVEPGTANVLTHVLSDIAGDQMAHGLEAVSARPGRPEDVSANSESAVARPH
jgi:hypothetical protein